MSALRPPSPRQRADDLLAEVDAPVRVALGRLVGEVRASTRSRSARRRRVVRVRRDERHEAEQLELGRGAGRDRHVGAAAPGPVGEVAQLARLAEVLALAVDAQAGGRGTRPGGSGPRRRAAASPGGLGGEAADEAFDGRHRGGSLVTSRAGAVTGPVVDELDGHVRAEHAARRAEPVARSARRAARRARAGRPRRRTGGCPRRGVAVERELGDAEHRAVAERLVHAPVGVGEDAQRADLVGQPVGRRRARRRA